MTTSPSIPLDANTADQRTRARGVVGPMQLSEVLDIATEEGYVEVFVVYDTERPTGELCCPSCGAASSSSGFVRAWTYRLEGVSDPADMLHVSALTCPNCGTRGVFMTPFGPVMSAHEAAVLQELPAPERYASPPGT